MKKTILLSTAAAVLMAGAASAQDTKWNLGAGYTYFDAEGGEIDVLNIRGGYDFTEYFGIEGELLIGLTDEDVVVNGVNASVGMDYGLGVFAKGQYPINEQVSLFGRLGYVHHELEAGVAGLTASEEDNGFAYGAGFEWAFSGPNAVRVDYTRYDYEDFGEADTFSIGYVRRF